MLDKLVSEAVTLFRRVSNALRRFGRVASGCLLRRAERDVQFDDEGAGEQEGAPPGGRGPISACPGQHVGFL